MTSSRIVLSFLILSCSAFVVSSGTAGIGGARGDEGPTEPAAGFTAAATLAGIVDSGQGPRARVRLTIVPHETDAVVTVTSITQEDAALAAGAGPAEARRELVRASLARGARRSFLVESDLEAGRSNDLFFLVTARGGGRTERQVVHLLVSLDDSRRPETVGKYIQYQGGSAQEQEMQP